MKKTIRIAINLCLPLFMFFGSYALIGLGNIAQTFKNLYQNPGSNSPSLIIKFAPCLKIIGFVGAGVSLLALLVWVVLIIRTKSDKYLFETADATAILLLIWTIGTLKIAFIAYSLYKPMFNIINFIK